MKDTEANSRHRSRLLTAVGLIGLMGFAAIHLVRPTLENPPVTAELKAPPEVKQVLRQSCYNCHSNETKLFWFDRIAPASWLVTNDVKEARTHLNFSELDKLPPAQQKALLYEAVNQIQLGGMPLKSYPRVHPDAIVSPEHLAILKNFLNPPAVPQPSDPSRKTIADEQYDKWIHASDTSLKVPAAPNGIAYFPDYKNWKTISTTDRFDNNTHRVIFGNDVAIKAIAENNIHPWPDGTVFAKAAWAQQVDDAGDTTTGA